MTADTGSGGGPRGRLELRVLGPLEVLTDGRSRDVGGPRLRTLLALLAADAGRVVGLPTLVDGLWGPDAPPDADRTVRTYVSRLRRALSGPDTGAAELIGTHPAGYLLRPPPDSVDAARFEQLVTAGRAALAGGRSGEAAALLGDGLALWRGEAYAEFDHVPRLHAESARLGRSRLAAVQDRIQADLAGGAGRDLVVELQGLTERHPGHERLWGQLMTALYRAGRQAEALEAYLRARAALIERSGVGPSAALTDIQQLILAGSPDLLGPTSSADPSAGTGRAAAPGQAPAPAPPAQLPPEVPGFTGRRDELAQLDRALPRPGPDPAGMAIHLVTGSAGVGKTALAVHWAHRCDGSFPDGQLYVNLRGFDPVGRPADPAGVLPGFLTALGVPAGQIPSDVDARAALYRSVLARRRVLVVLDNAADATQVRPLLPAAPGCLVLVTSRHDLAGLVARDGARRITVDVLPAGDALALLGTLIGAAAADPATTGPLRTLAARCARLPLALRIAADRVVSRGDLTGVVAELAPDRRRLDLLDSGMDAGTAVRAVFSWSERQLVPAAARLFALLGLHPGREIGPDAVVALAGLPAGRAAGLLDELRAAHLVEPAGADRVVMHDLLRAYARERAVELIGAADRRAALAALYERYLSRSASAMDAAFPATRNRRPDVGAAGGAPAFTDAAQALRWLDAERHTLVDLAATEVDERAPLLARVIGGYLGVGFHTADQFTVHRHALTTARRRGDPAGEARALLELGKAHGRSGDLAAALRYGREAAEVFGRIGDDAGLAEACTHTGANEAWLGRPEVALRDYRMALLLSRRCGDRAGEAAACASIGQLHRAAGRHRAALGLLRRAVRIYAEAGDRTGEGRARNDLGTQLRLLGRYLEALDCHERARQLLHAVGDRAAEACALSDLGRIYSRWGRHGDAISHHERALATFREIDDRIGEAEALDALADAHELAGRPGPAGELRARAAARYAELRMPRADASPAAAGPADDLPARLTTPSG